MGNLQWVHRFTVQLYGVGAYNPSPLIQSRHLLCSCDSHPAVMFCTLTSNCRKVQLQLL